MTAGTCENLPTRLSQLDNSPVKRGFGGGQVQIATTQSHKHVYSTAPDKNNESSQQVLLFERNTELTFENKGLVL
jgi:hypothetical protein